MEVLNENSRSSLSEGRNYGIGFAWAEKKGKVIKTINPVSPCKDYLNDQCAVEAGYGEFRVYGLKSEKRNLFEKKAYLVIRTCDSYKNEEKGKELSEAEQKINYLLKENYKNIEMVLNSVEEQFIKERTKIYEANNGYYVIDVPTIWTINGPMISFYALIVRNAIYGAKDIDDLFLNKKVYNVDHNFLGYALAFYYFIKNGIIPEVNYKDKQFELESGSVHNYGVVEYIKRHFKS